MPDGGKDNKKHGQSPAPRKRFHRARRVLAVHRRLTIPFKIFLALLILGMLLFIGAYAAYKWYTNPAAIRSQAEAQLEKFFPGKLTSVAGASFGVLSGLDLRDVRVRDRGPGEDIIHAEQVHVDFETSKLVKFKVVPKAVSVAGAFANIARSKDGAWNLQIPEFGGGGPPPVAMPFTASVTHAFVSMNDRRDNYAVSFTIDNLVAVSDETTLSKWRTTANLGSALLGKWRVTVLGNAEEKTLSADFHVENIDLGNGMEARLPPLLRHPYGFFSPSGPADINGRISFSPREAWHWDVTLDLKGGGGIYDRFPVVAQAVTGQVRFANSGVRFQRITARAAGGDILVSGETEGYGSSAGAHVTVNTKGTQVTGDVLAAMPPGAGRAAAMFNPSGVVDCDVVIDRQAGPDKDVILRIDCYPRDLSAKYQAFPLPVSNITGHFTVSGGDVNFEDIRGKGPGNGEFTIAGSVKHASSSPDVSVKIEAKNLSLDETLRDLLPKSAASFWRDLAFVGQGDADVLVTKPPDKPAAFDIRVSVGESQVKYKNFPYLLSGGRGNLSFKEGTLTIDAMKFSRGATTFGVAGTVDTSTGRTNLKFEARDIALNSEFIGSLPPAGRKPLEAIDLAGVASARMGLTYDKSNGVGIGEIAGTLEGGQFFVPGAPLAMGNASGDFRYAALGLDFSGISGAVFPDNSLLLLPAARFAALARPKETASASGHISFDRNAPGWQAQTSAKSLFVDDSFLSNLSAGAGGALEALDARAFLDAGGNLSSGAYAAPADFTFNLALRSIDSSLDVGRQIQAAAGDAAIEGESKGKIVTFKSQGSLSSLVFAGSPVADARYAVEKTPSEVRLYDFSGIALGGKVNGRARFETAGARGYGISAAFDDLNLHDVLLKALGFENKNLAGRVSGGVKLESISNRPEDLIGSADVEITKGTLWEVPVVFAMLNVMNLKLPERTKFDSAKLSCKIAGRKLLIDEMSVSSDPATFVGKGTIGFDGTLDITFYAQPGRIPVVSLLAGEVGRNIVVGRMTGTFSKPKVALVPSGPFGGIVGWFRKALGGE